MFVLRYDMKSTVDGGWRLPETKNTNVTTVIIEPDTDIEVEVTPREGFERGRWNVALNDSETVFAVVAEDRGEVDIVEHGKREV